MLSILFILIKKLEIHQCLFLFLYSGAGTIEGRHI